VVWDPGKAFRETTATRERLCINGLWRWQPLPRRPVQCLQRLGLLQGAGLLARSQDYLRSDYQTLYPTELKQTKLSEVQRAWYERTISIPSNWRAGASLWK